MKKLLNSTIIFAISLLISVKIAYFIGENFFFDKFFYRKSPAHGYSLVGPFGNPIPYVNSFDDLEIEIKERLRPLYQLMYLSDQTNLNQKNEEFTIAFIGDSMSFGTGVKKEQTLVNILEKKLNKIRPTKIINYSMPGDNALDNYAKYKKAKENRDIDLFIIGIVDNDLLFDKSSTQYPLSKELYSEILNYCQKELKTFPYESLFTWEEQIENIYFPSISEEYANIDYFKKIVSLIDNSDTFYFSFGYVPQEEDFKNINISDMPKLWQVYAKYNEIISHNGGLLLNPYLENREYLPISEKEKHPSKEMHQQYAETLFREITTNKKWKFDPI